LVPPLVTSRFILQCKKHIPSDDSQYVTNRVMTASMTASPCNQSSDDSQYGCQYDSRQSM
jgi:hypothetical protein